MSLATEKKLDKLKKQVIKTKDQIKIQSMAFASQLLPAIIGVGSFMLLVRTANPQVLGQYLVFLAAVVLCEMVKAGGLQSALVMRISGNDTNHQKRIIGSAYYIGGLFSISLSAILGVLYLSGVFIHQPGIEIFCGWYACLGLITVPLHIADATGVARQDLRFLLFLRLFQSANALLIACYAWLFKSSLEAFASVYVLFNLLVVLIILISGKTNPLLVFQRTKEEILALVKLIKYAFGTLATTNLLKSADTFLIASLMGPESVARYAIPLKLTELFDIPLRSLSTTAFPQLAARYNKQDILGFKSSFVEYISWAYLLYIPALTVAFIFAPWIVLAMGGQQYADTTPIFRIFILYGLLLPLDRLTGISLDALQKPARNFLKVVIMATVNIIGDVLAITLTHNLAWVAFASVLNAATGALLGWWMLKKTGVMAPGKIGSDVFAYSSGFIRNGIQRLNR